MASHTCHFHVRFFKYAKAEVAVIRAQAAMSREDLLMRYEVKQLKNLAIALRELEPHVRNGQALRTGKVFKSIGQRPRELLGNWLLAAVACHERRKETVRISSDPMGGDSILRDAETGEKMFLEHVYIPPQEMGGREIGELFKEAVAHKTKKGNHYAAGRTLLVFSEAGGYWVPTRVARDVADTHNFEGVWAISLDAEAINEGRYSYNIADLGGDNDQTPIWCVTLREDFKSWTVSVVQ